MLLQEWNETTYPMLGFECGKGKVIRQNWEMKKRRLFKAGTIIFLVIAAALVFNKILEEWTGFRKVLDTITGAAAPIIIGFVIAFLLNPVLIFLIACVIRSYRIG